MIALYCSTFFFRFTKPERSELLALNAAVLAGFISFIVTEEDWWGVCLKGSRYNISKPSIHGSFWVQFKVGVWGYSKVTRSE